MLRKLIKGLVNIAYPRICLVCKKQLSDKQNVHNLVCAHCWTGIRKSSPPFCHSCGRHLEKSGYAKNMCPACLKKVLHFDRAFSPCIYDGPVKELIHSFKYKNKEQLGEPLSRLMIDFINEFRLPVSFVDFILPVPLHKTRMREREFNQAYVLGRRLAEEFNKPLLSDALIRSRHTRTQTKLETEQRFLNVAGSFTVNKKIDLKGKNLLLVDDVLTSGATCSEAAKVLKESGAGIVFIMTVAH
jgi:ComF family protein